MKNINLSVAGWFVLDAVQRSSFAFAPASRLGRSHPLSNHARISSGGGRSHHSFLHARADEPIDDSSAQPTKDVSYAALLNVIDKSHNDEVNELCPYLATEHISQAQDVDGGIIQDRLTTKSYHSPVTPVLSEEAVNALRHAAQSYFDHTSASDGTFGIERVDLDEILSADVGWKNALNDALTESIYPLVRSGWPNHDAFTLTKDSELDETDAGSEPDSPVLTVTSASVFAGGGYPGAKVATTTFERDAGLFVVHIDLGNGVDDSVMGALYLESLADGSIVGGPIVGEPIVGPLSPGQVVVHRSMERTAAITVPSNIHSLGQRDTKSTLDSPSRRNILAAAEQARHYSLRLVLTTKCDAKTKDESSKHGVPEAPSGERSYRLRSYARFREDRVRYLTLAGLLDVNDYENHLWLGFDYIARMDNSDNQQDIRQNLSDTNKAIFHLERAADLCPTDARVHFQLATAYGAKMDCEKRLLLEPGDDAVDMDCREEMTGLAQVATALERSAQLESAAVRVGVSGIQDLAICYNALAETRCKMGQFDKALDVIDRWAECGSIRSALAYEDLNISLASRMPSYEWIQAPGNEDTDGNRRNVAVRTVGDVPVFEPDDVNILRQAADKRFALAAGIQTSRYTMQYEGNSEVHLDDLCAGDPHLKARMDQILKENIYPLVRAAFADDNDGDEPPLGPMCVYDSIFVRYNGDVARAAGRLGASQPLHQDGGIYSVNIALNAHKDDDENGFTGGGTFLEALTVGDEISHIQRPIAPGHAIAHKTTQRHAGAPTTSGVRDILVIFLTARHPLSVERDPSTWRVERAMRLQSMAKELPRDKLIPSLQLARANDPVNSEVPFWIGVHSIQGDMTDPTDERWEEICQGVESLKASTLLNPADARAHYHLGMGITTRHKYAMQTRRAHLLPPPKEAADMLVKAFETAIRLEGKCQEAGCQNGINLAAAYLALGDFMARLKEVDKAIAYLNQIEPTIRRSGDIDENWAHSMLEEASSILQFCEHQSVKEKESSLA